MAMGFNGALLHTLGAKDHVLTVTGKEWRDAAQWRV